jgi:hypothetical protein
VTPLALVTRRFELEYDEHHGMEFPDERLLDAAVIATVVAFVTSPRRLAPR